MAYQEVNGGPRTRTGPAFQSGLQPVLEGDGVPSPGQFADFLRTRKTANGSSAQRFHVAGGTKDSAHHGGTLLTAVTGKRENERRTGQTSTGRRKENKERSRKLELVHTPIHDALVEELTERSAEWIDIVERLKKQRLGKTVDNIQGRLAELHVEQILRRLAKTDRFRNTLQIHLLDGDIKTDSFIFRRSAQGGIYVDSDKGTHTEFDNALMVKIPGGENIPTIIEVKAQSDPRRAEEFLREEHWRRAMRPIQKRYGKRAALIYMTTPEGIDMSSPVVQKFIADGGYMVLMKPSLKDFREWAALVNKSAGVVIDLPGPALKDVMKR